MCPSDAHSMICGSLTLKQHPSLNRKVIVVGFGHEKVKVSISSREHIQSQQSLSYNLVVTASITLYLREDDRVIINFGMVINITKVNNLSKDLLTTIGISTSFINEIVICMP